MRGGEELWKDGEVTTDNGRMRDTKQVPVG